jgi:hypothetical protein
VRSPWGAVLTGHGEAYTDHHIKKVFAADTIATPLTLRSISVELFGSRPGADASVSLSLVAANNLFYSVSAGLARIFFIQTDH